MEEERIVRGPFVPVDIPDTDIYSTLVPSFRERADQLALVDLWTGEEFSFGKIEEEVERAASRMYHSHQLRKGDKVALCAQNSARYVIMMCAVLRLGAVVVGINHLLTVDDIRKMLKVVHAKLVYTSSAVAGVVVQAVDGSTVEMVICDESYPGCVSYDNLVSRVGKMPTIPTTESLKIRPKEDTTLILFSSGTTGVPKAVGLSHYNNNATTFHFLHKQVGQFSERQVIYQPMSHIFGANLALLGLVAGSVSYVMRKFDLTEYISTVAKYKVDMLALAPPVAVMIAKAPIVDEFDLRHVTKIGTGAGPISAEVEKEVIRRLGGKIQWRPVYGLTELAGVATCIPSPGYPPADKAPPGTVGVLAPNTQAKIIDTDTGRCLGPHEDGEVLIRGPQVMLGYIDNPQATADMVDTEGWLHTGDIGHYDQDGFIFIVDRLKELIKYKGYQVSPVELEIIILTHPDVEDAGVFSVADSLAGELPRAWVVRKEASQVTERDILSFVEHRVAPFKKLKGGVRFVASIPRLASGKVIRREMKRGDLIAKI